MAIELNCGRLKNGTYIEKHLYSLRKMSMTTNVEWLVRMIKSKRICINGGVWDNDWEDYYIDFIKDLVRFMDDFYRDDWDIHLERHVPCTTGNRHRKWVFSLCPVIRYRKATITNKNNQSKELKDFIVVHRIVKNSDAIVPTFYLGTPYGTKAKFRVEEIEQGYVHSHLHEKEHLDSYGYHLRATEFCTGSSEINDLKSQLRGGFNVELAEMQALMMRTFVSWESIEGTPYIYMERCFDSNNRMDNDPSIHNLKVWYSRLTPQIRKTPNLLKLNYVIQKGRYSIKNDNQLARTLKDIAEKSPILRNRVLCKKAADGIYYSFTEQGKDLDLNKREVEELNNELRNRLGERPYLYIRGEKVEVEVIETPRSELKEPDKIEEFKVHPKFIEYAKQKFEEQLYEASIRHSQFRDGVESEDAETVVGQDQVPV